MLPTARYPRRFGRGLAALLFASAAVSFGCGGAKTRTVSTSVYRGQTRATLLASNVSGDEPVKLTLSLARLTLTSQSGTTVTVFSKPNCAAEGAPACLNIDFMGVNGRVSAPLLSANIPQGTYTSANAVVTQCRADVMGATASGGAGMTDTCDIAPGVVAPQYEAPVVAVPVPLTISGTGIALNLQLDFGQALRTLNSACLSASTACTLDIEPAFILTAASIAQPPTSVQNGLITGVNGQIQTVTSGSLQLLTGEGAKLTLATNSETQIQGLAALADLAPKMYVQADAALQPDGSLLATRIEADDPSSLYWTTGTLATGMDALSPQFLMYSAQTLGTGLVDGIAGYSITAATAFKTDAAFSNVSGLPFPATFNAQTMVGGQSVSLFYSQLQGPSSYSSYPPVSTITLEPQALEGSVAAVSQSGQFTVYQLTLAADNLFSALKPITGPFLHPTDPSVVYAYAGPSTLAPNAALTAGTTAVFRGLLFDDNGTLRMDCERVIPVGQ